jgi:hypothetical protein
LKAPSGNKGILNMKTPTYLTLLAMIIAVSCAPRETAAVSHTVVLWLKAPVNEAHRQTIIEETKKLASIPGVLSVSVGPCIESDRPIVDSTFDVAITMTFPSVDAMHRYINHPTHRRMVKEKLMPLVDKIKVFDFRIQQ